MHAVILAAGQGTRMRPLTEALPKAMVPIGSSSLIARNIARLQGRVEQVHVTVGHHAGVLGAHVLESGAASAVLTEGHGNCWWIYGSVAGRLPGPVLVQACDVAADLDLDALLADYLRQGSPACMLVGVEPVDGIAGDHIFATGDVIDELSRTRRAPLYGSGIQLVDPARIRDATDPVEDFTALWGQLIRRGELRLSRVRPATWWSANTIRDLEPLRDDVSDRQLPRAAPQAAS
jgi:NDP-sugar pyrophosphorylase family protein